MIPKIGYHTPKINNGNKLIIFYLYKSLMTPSESQFLTTQNIEKQRFTKSAHGGKYQKYVQINAVVRSYGKKKDTSLGYRKDTKTFNISNV